MKPFYDDKIYVHIYFKLIIIPEVEGRHTWHNYIGYFDIGSTR